MAIIQRWPLAQVWLYLQIQRQALHTGCAEDGQGEKEGNKCKEKGTGAGRVRGGKAKASKIKNQMGLKN